MEEILLVLLENCLKFESEIKEEKLSGSLVHQGGVWEHQIRTVRKSLIKQALNKHSLQILYY